jgi:transcriptional regulator NrdR family protein
MALVIKKRGHKEEFDQNKIFESAYAACLQSGLELVEAQLIGKTIASKVGSWVGRRKEHIHSSEVFAKVAKELRDLDCHDAAYIYENMRDIC